MSVSMQITKDDNLSEMDMRGRHFLDKIIVLSKGAAVDFRCEKPWVCVSIATYKDFARINAHWRIALLQMAFPDIDLPRKGFDPFTEDQANEVLDFTEMYWKVAEVVMLHCEAGISRSAAIGAALHKIYVGGDNDQYWKWYRPNARVYSEMLKAAVKRGLWDPQKDPDRPHSVRETADPATTNLFGD